MSKWTNLTDLYCIHYHYKRDWLYSRSLKFDIYCIKCHYSHVHYISTWANVIWRYERFESFEILAFLGSDLKFEVRCDHRGYWVALGASKKKDEKKVYGKSEFEPTILVTWSGHFTTAPQRLRGIRTRTRFSNLASFTLMYTEFRDTTGPRLHWSHLWPWGRVHTTKDRWFAELCISQETFFLNTISESWKRNLSIFKWYLNDFVTLPY